MTVFSALSIRRLFGAAVFVLLLATLVAGPAVGTAFAETWRGLQVAPEYRCSPYDADDYHYPQSVEDRITAQLGGVYGPYSGRWFASDTETDIEHMVARSEAHDSGLCAADDATRRAFARDLLNLTLAAPGLNRYQKSDRDAAEWLPQRNRCWFAARVYRGSPAPPARRAAPAAPTGDPLALYDDNGNGRITCAEARRHGIAPVPRSHPAYRFMRDGDGDGVVCE